MTLLQLQYFIRTAKMGSTLQASQFLNVSQSTVSTAIKMLETELGVKLFSRSSKGLILNQAGRCLLEHAENILDRVDAAAYDMKKFAVEAAQIQIGIPVILSANYWPDLYLMFHKRMPETEVCVTNGGTKMLMDMLEKNRLDLVLSFSSVTVGDRIRREVLLDGIRRTVSVSSQSPLAREKTVTYDQLISYPVLGYEGDEVKTAMLQKMYEKRGGHLNYVQRCSQISTLLQLVRKDAGIAYLNEKMTENEEGIVTIPIEGSGMDIPLCVFWNDSARGGGRIKTAIRLIKEYFEREKTDV